MRAYIVLWGLWAFLTAHALGETYLVIPGSHLGDFPDIQTAIDSVLDGDIIELADGVFWGTGNWDIDWHDKEVTIRSRSGNPEACFIDGAGIWHEQHRGFYIHDVGVGAVLDRVTIRNCEAVFGGGIRIVNASPTITGCIFLENEAGDGGAVLCAAGATPTIQGCTFHRNCAAQGAGIMCQDGLSTIIRCTFSDNDGSRGGGLCI